MFLQIYNLEVIPVVFQFTGYLHLLNLNKKCSFVSTAVLCLSMLW